MCNVKYPDLASQLVVNHHQEKIGSEYIYIYIWNMLFLPP